MNTANKNRCQELSYITYLQVSLQPGKWNNGRQAAHQQAEFRPLFQFISKGRNCFQNKLPSLLVRSFLAQQHLTACTPDLYAAVSHPAECGACVMLTAEMGSCHDTLWYLGMHPSYRIILFRIKGCHGTGLCIHMQIRQGF